MTEIERRRKALRKCNIPEDYIDLYFYIITKDLAYLPESYKTKTGHVNKIKTRKGSQELNILFGKIIVDGDYDEKYLSY